MARANSFSGQLMAPIGPEARTLVVNGDLRDVVAIAVDVLSEHGFRLVSVPVTWDQVFVDAGYLIAVLEAGNAGSAFGHSLVWPLLRPSMKSVDPTDVGVAARPITGGLTEVTVALWCHYHGGLSSAAPFVREAGEDLVQRLAAAGRLISAGPMMSSMKLPETSPLHPKVFVPTMRRARRARKQNRALPQSRTAQRWSW